MRWLVHLKSMEREREMGRLITAKKLPAFCSATAQPGTAVKPVKNSSRWGSRLSRDASSCQGTVGEENGAACPAACDHNEEENSHSCIQINVTTTMCFCPTFFSPPLILLKASVPFSIHQRYCEHRVTQYSCVAGLMHLLGGIPHRCTCILCEFLVL